MEKVRCPWCGEDPLYVRYHDEEWGVPVRDDKKLFEFLVLESFQSGLSWLTILRKRENFRSAFDGFDPNKIANYGEQEIAYLLTDKGIVRNRAKIEATIANAKAFLQIQETIGSFHAYLWGFLDGAAPIVNRPKTLKDIGPVSDLAVTISKDMKRRGFKFLGPTVMYAHMQATGLVNDHLVECFRHPDNQRQEDGAPLAP